MSNDAKNIVESGDLELFALGLLDAARHAHVEGILAIDSDLRAELVLVQQSIETYARAHAKKPADHVRKRVLDAAFAADAEAQSQTESPGTTQSKAVTPTIQPKKDSPNASLLSLDAQQSAKVLLLPRQSTSYRYALVASVACLISTTAALYFWNEARSMQQDLHSAQSQIAALKGDQTVMAARLNVHEKHFAMLHDKQWMQVDLRRQAAAPEGAESIVMWNKTTHEVYLEPRNLPITGADHDYQLWALIDGKPVDLGVYSSSESMPMAQMKSIAAADAFAITMEPKGGSKSPTLTQLMVMGKVSS